MPNASSDSLTCILEFILRRNDGSFHLYSAKMVALFDIYRVTPGGTLEFV